MSSRIARPVEGGSRLVVPAAGRHPLLTPLEERILRIVAGIEDAGDVCRLSNDELAALLDRSHQTIRIARGRLRRWGLIAEDLVSRPGTIGGAMIGIRITELGRDVLEADE